MKSSNGERMEYPFRLAHAWHRPDARNQNATSRLMRQIGTLTNLDRFLLLIIFTINQLRSNSNRMHPVA
jgi:hypothetical protein